MKAIKFTIQSLIMLILIFSTIGVAFADINVEISPTTAHVGDIVTITVSASNDDLVDWSPVIIYAPIPDGLKYLSHVVPDRERQDYDIDTGLWDVNRMRHDERGHLKYLIITTKVLPEAAGKQLTATARFQTLIREASGQDITDEVAPARAHTATISSTNDEDNGGTGNGTGNGTGSGNGNGVGSGTGNGNNLINSAGNTKLSNIMSNFTNPDSEDNSLLNLQKGGGGNGKSYEIINATQNPPTTQDTSYAILAILAVIAIIAYGYFKEMKN